MTASIGTRVSYEDMANPLREGEIVGDLGHSWLVRWDGDDAPSTYEIGGVSVAFSSSVTKHMLDRAVARQRAFRADGRGHRCGGWDAETSRVDESPTRRANARDYAVGSLVSRDGSRNADGSEARFLVVGFWRGNVKLLHRATGTTTCAAPTELELVAAATPDTVVEAKHFQGLELTRAQKTETLAASFRDTDRALDQPGLTADQRADLSVARGWIIDVLEERGALATIGLDDEYRELAPGARVRIVSEKSRLHGTLATVSAVDSQQIIVQPDGEAESPVCVWTSDDLVRLERVEQ